MLPCRAPSGRVGDPGKAPLPLAAPATEQRSRAQPCTPPCGDTFFASLIPTPFWGEPPCSSAASARLPHTGCCGRNRGRPSLGPSVRGAAPSSGLPRPRAPPRGSARSRPELALSERPLRTLGTAEEERPWPLRRRGERSAPARPALSLQPGQSLHGYPRGFGRRRAGRKRPHSMQPPVPMRHTCCGRSQRARAGLRPAARPGPASEEHNGRRLRGWAVGVGVLGGTDGETLPCDSVWNGSLESAGGGEAAGPPSAAGLGPGRGLPLPRQVGGSFERCRRAEPRRPPGSISPTPKPAPPGCRGRRYPGPAGLPPCPRASGLEGQPGAARPLLLFRPTKDGRSHTLPALVVQPLRRRCGRCAWARSGSSFRSRGAAGNRVPQRCCLSFPTPVAELSRARLHSACGPCAASDQSPLLAAQHPGGIAIARNGRTSSLPLCYHRAAPFSEYKVLHANLFIESY